jgi:hypothetical protein
MLIKAGVLGGDDSLSQLQGNPGERDKGPVFRNDGAQYPSFIIIEDAWLAGLEDRELQQVRQVLDLR